ncbi:hypothetical protein [Noviherbaspirillum humi]
MKTLMVIALSAGLLAACGEIDQTKSAQSANRDDAAPWQGAKNAFVASSWAPGDKTSWENQLRARSMGQNEYNKIN